MVLNYRNRCPSPSQQFDNDRPSLAARVSVDRQLENTRTADTALVHQHSVTEGNATCRVGQHHAYDRHIMRLGSSESTECPDSIFDYQSTHPSVDLDDVCLDGVDGDDVSVGYGSVDVNTDSRSVGKVILAEEHQKTKTVASSQSAQVTASTAVSVNENYQSVAPLATSKSELPPSSSGLPLVISSSQMQSRLPGPRSRAAVKVAPASHHTSKPAQLKNGLVLTGVAAASAGSKLGLSRFH